MNYFIKRTKNPEYSGTLSATSLRSIGGDFFFFNTEKENKTKFLVGISNKGTHHVTTDLSKQTSRCIVGDPACWFFRTFHAPVALGGVTKVNF